MRGAIESRGEGTPAFDRALRTIGRHVSADPRDLANGAPATWQGLVFWILDHGSLDPQGLTVAIRTATLPADAPPAAYRQLLNHNAMMPAGLSGFFAMAPGADEVLYCLRFDLSRGADAGLAILEMVERMATQLAQSLDVLAQEMARASAAAN